MLNKELLKETLDIIKLKPSEYDQTSWVRVEEANVCGTAMCFAGHAAILAGAEAPDPKKHYVADWYVNNSDKAYLNWQQYDAAEWGTATSVARFAQAALGLDYDQADYIFDGDRTVDEIEHAVNTLIETGDYVPPSSYYDEDDDDYYCCPSCG